MNWVELEKDKHVPTSSQMCLLSTRIRKVENKRCAAGYTGGNGMYIGIRFERRTTYVWTGKKALKKIFLCVRSEMMMDL